MEQAIIESQNRGLPIELANIIINGQGSRYLEAVAISSFDTRLADLILPPFHHLLPEIAQRWIRISQNTSTLKNEVITISCLARILPLATYLEPTIKRFLSTSRLLEEIRNPVTNTLRDHEYVQVLLLALFRLLSYDTPAFTKFVKPVFLCSLFNHELVHVRFLAIECFCQVMELADAFCQRLLKQHCGTDDAKGQWDDQEIDYRVLKLFEEKRWENLNMKVREFHELRSTAADGEEARFKLDDLSPLTASIASILVPRHQPVGAQKSSFVPLATASENLKSVARTLHYSKPTLLVGPSGAGKTAIVREVAHELGALSSMITLHLNDQTDAKSLLGIYTSSEQGGGFSWQPGVLTKAVLEGRWVLIEDIDRAPAEVLGLLRPLVENNQLFLPSRKELLRPQDGFRLFGTIRGVGGSAMSSSGRSALLANRRLWNTVDIRPYSTEEISVLLQARFPNLTPFMGNIVSAHTKILRIYSSHPSFKALQSRSPSIREVLKWCRRLSRRLSTTVTAAETVSVVPETFMIDMLKHGMDCYAAHLGDEETYQILADGMAESLNIAPSAAQHALTQQNPVLQQHKNTMQIGRSFLPRLGARRSRGASASRFALTRRVRQNMEMIAAATMMQEPVLLVGETGVGKTTMLQHIASSIDQNLTAVNLSNQSEASDLLGGLKPVTTRSLLVPLVDEFESLFDDTFSANKNEKFRQSIAKAFAKQRWQRLVGHWEEAVQLAQRSLPASPRPDEVEGQSAKRRKVDHPKYLALRDRWASFGNNINQAKAQIQRGEQSQVFSFVESRLVQAVRNGSWLLLDEINLASPETLDNLLSLLHNGEDDTPYLLLTEAGSIERINAHPNFRVFAAMNPATDTGKKDLPFAVRAHFTEIYVHAGDTDVNDLVEIIQTYLGTALDSDKKAANDLAKAYLALKQLSLQHKLTDGAGDLPHFSLRSLTRCLQYAQRHGPSHGLRRAMYEGMQMSFFTVLDLRSQQLALSAVEQNLISSAQAKKALLGQRPKVSIKDNQYVAFAHHLIPKGPLLSDVQPHYIITDSVHRNLMNLARASSMRRFPVLLQGPTSAGKTSMVEYLAKYSGNKFVRINNHEHTDLQEYLGSYASNADGKLEYREGVLVEALRQGYWIVLDELNLAPSDVLEALNRLLDDNRELLIPESQEIVHPHPNFMLFATQNPAGLYGGRKRLSRAFRNRFLEIHVDDIPEDELERILTERSQIAPQYCKRIVKVYKDLSLQRQSSRLFEARNSFATLRDLFRWASRPADDRDQLGYHGYMLLAERVRDPAEKEVVRRTIEENFKIKIDDEVLYGRSRLPSSIFTNGKVTWTRAMRRLFVLVSDALQSNEPVLLVGETGCGKTQVCQCIAEVYGKQLNIYNAHSNTETGDLIGSQRPMRHKSELGKTIVEELRNLGDNYDSQRTSDSMDIEDLITQFKAMDTSAFDQVSVEKIHESIAAYQSLFSWSDGSLVRSMKEGSHFLLDEISLADDSVLERMNSLLEPARSILLAEKGAENNFVVAQNGFQFLATMNPGGDYGKRELSAALRNRLTEIWVPPLSDDEDIIPILEGKLGSEHKNLALMMVNFARYFRSEIQGISTKHVPLRTLLIWTDFIVSNTGLGIEKSVVHGAAIAFLDSLGANPAGLSSNVVPDLISARNMCLGKLSEQLQIDARAIYNAPLNLKLETESLILDVFSIPRSTVATSDGDLVFEAPTTLRNAMRIVRALQINRPLLLEGNPGVGKTAIVSSLAKMCGKQLTRINLSDQTDLMDLFGADAPATDENFGSFVWRDGPLLKAMQSGGWVLLDEMNLASQSVLEGLNACLDHRQEVYIAELDKTFKCHPDFILFATQNPHHQGGGRKGLPASFVNRFVVVYADPFTRDDLISICKTKYPTFPEHVVSQVVTTINDLEHLTSRRHEFHDGGPWELNLRDLHRWLSLCNQDNNLSPVAHFETVVSGRFRSPSAQKQAADLCSAVLPSDQEESLYHHLAEQYLQVGTAFMNRSVLRQSVKTDKFIHNSRLSTSKSVITALNQGWPIVMVGASDSGKTTLIRTMAALSGSRLVEFSMSADVDAADLVGGYEQYEPLRDIKALQERLRDVLLEAIQQQFHALHPSPTGDHELLFTFLMAFDHVNGPTLSPTELREVMQPVLDMHNQPDSSILEPLRRELQDLGVMADNTSARFVWNDGILVEALENGSWLVLDNANLCNPSVLDRLNSLLEPNGSLIISEQHGTDGEVRIVRPHPDFRIILTMDPKFGELSRAMRNRSLEVFLNGQTEDKYETDLPRYPSATYVARLRTLLDVPSDVSDSVSKLEPYLGNMSGYELCLVQHLRSITKSGKPEAEADYWNKAVTTASECGYLYELSFSHAAHPILQVQYQASVALVNEPLVQLFSSAAQRSDLQCLTEWAYLLTRLFRCQAFLRDIEKGDLHKTSDTLSWLERSTPSMIKQSRRQNGLTIKAYALTHGLSQFIFRLLSYETFGASLSWQDPGAIEVLESQLCLLEDLISFFNQIHVEEAQSRAYLQASEDVKNVLVKYIPAWSELFTEIIRPLGDVHDLAQYQSLQRMWPEWKGMEARSEEQLYTQLKMEKIVSTFDGMCPDLPHSRAELASLRMKLLSALASVSSQNFDKSQVEVYEGVMNELTQANKINVCGTPHFAVLFETVFRKMLCKGEDPLSLQAQKWAVLGGVHLRAFPHDIHNSTIQSLSRVGACSSMQSRTSNREIVPPGELGLQEVSRLLSVTHDQPIGRMSYAIEELTELSRVFARNGRALASDSLKVLRDGLMLLVQKVLLAHDDFLTSDERQLIETLPVDQKTLDRLLTEVARKAESNGQQDVSEKLGHWLKRSVQSVSEGHSYNKLGQGLVLFAATTLSLMMTEKAFDPAQYLILVSQRRQKELDERLARVSAWKSFQTQFCGQKSSLMIRMLEEHVVGLGQPPKIPKIFRPDARFLEELSSEMSNLRRNVLSDSKVIMEIVDGDNQERLSRGSSMLEKISRCVNRLHQIHRAYDDLVQPVVGLLHILTLGVRMLIFNSQQEMNPVRQMQVTTPNRHDRKRQALQQVEHKIESMDPIINNYLLPLDDAEKLSIPQTWNYLRQLRLKLLVGNNRPSDKAYLIAHITNVIQGPYVAWTQRVDKDRAMNEINLRYYSYRGENDTDDIKEDDVRTAFPSFETDDTAGDEKVDSDENPENANFQEAQFDVRKIAIELARYHRSLFAATDHKDLMRSFLRDQMHLRDETHPGLKEAEILNSNTMPSLLLSLEDILATFSGTHAKALNIYTDSDIGETQKLFKIASDATSRFEEIRAAWPDHAVPTDVLQFLSEVMSLKMSDPIAKLLTKAEKLLQVMSQWQAVASREWSVLNIMEALTNLIIHWRRLELGSWSRLLDLEDQKQQDDTDSWYFIAYGAVIYKSLLSVQTAAEGRPETPLPWYRRELGRTLEEYLTATTLGQYSSRLELLRIFAHTVGAFGQYYLDQWDDVCRKKHGTKLKQQARDIMELETKKIETNRITNGVRPHDGDDESDSTNVNFTKQDDENHDMLKHINGDFGGFGNNEEGEIPAESKLQMGRHLNEIQDVILNVVNHHARYEPQIRKQLLDGRAALEKGITEQIKLASWKDTNITALKESARRSHFKLFKIVKKYRTLLAQPITSLSASYMPIPKAISEPDTVTIPPSASGNVRKSIETCQKSLIDWSSRPDRLKNPLGATTTMQHVYTTALPSFLLGSELSSYLSEITTTTQELRKLTPSTLTDDNKSLIRDLKQRKRKLVADTMRDLGQMGIRRNLGTNELASQRLRAQIFADIPGIPIGSTPATSTQLNEAFYELLDTLPEAREATLKHSEELSAGEVNRGLGYLEGLLALCIKQRTHWWTISTQLSALHRLTNISKILQQKQINEFNFLTDSKDSQVAHMWHHTAWLPVVLEVYAGIADFQEKQAELGFGGFSKKLRERASLIRAQHDKLQNLSALPTGLGTGERSEVILGSLELIDQLRNELETYVSSEPELEYIVENLREWLLQDTNTTLADTSRALASIESLDKDSRNFQDTVFVALQRATEALKSLPASPEDRDWLTKSTDILGRATSSLHLEALYDSCESIFNTLQYLDISNLKVGISLIVVASPIQQQFYSICVDIQKRIEDVHLHTTQLAVFLGKTFIALVKDGFCGPSEASEGQEQSGKVEQGTGLGDGEAAEDISKDVADDEDLTDLAQQPAEKDKEGQDMDKSKDAVDMGHDDLEGEMGSGDEQVSDDESAGSDGEEGEDQDQNEETGSVDDLDPNAVDEKMWDDMQKEAEKEDKEMKSQKAQGQKTDDQAAKGDGEEEDSGDDMEANDGQDEDEDAADDEGQQQAEGENLDPHLQEEQALELPEEMQLNGEEEKADNDSDMDMDNMSDVDDGAQAENKQEVDELPDEDKMDREDSPGKDDTAPDDEEHLANGKADEDEVTEDQPDLEDDEDDVARDTRQDEEMGDMQDQENGESGNANTNQPDFGAEKDENAPQGQNESETAAQESEPQKGQQSNAKQQTGANEGAVEQGIGRQEDTHERQNDALKKLADVLEKYHQRREIFTAAEDRQHDQAEQDVDMADADFEHLDGEPDENDLQALGTSNQEVSQNIDQSKAIEDSTSKAEEDLPMPEDGLQVNAKEQETVIEKFNRLQAERDDKDESVPKSRDTLIPESARDHPRKELDTDVSMVNMDEDEEDLPADELNLDQLNSLAIRNATTSLADAQQLWSLTSNKTQSLSLMLTEQLRLILQPTTATKLRGDFRTGKRLNIRRIIPYIASGYKRDKIWMRRSVPSKRNYQIMLAVDDSKSMAESGADILALETLCMLSRSLSMLEVGELSIVAFGSDYTTSQDTSDNIVLNSTTKTNKAVKVAHPFSTPFSPNQSGPETFRSFTFNQPATNIHALLSQSIALFADARLKSSAREAADLWQLQIIISDGHIGSDTNDSMRRLVRKAREEKIMSVFVIVDGGEESIVELNEVFFETKRVANGRGGETEEEVMRTRRYLEGFPFQYYVVVREVAELPGVLSRVLKGWFEGVVEMG